VSRSEKKSERKEWDWESGGVWDVARVVARVVVWVEESVVVWVVTSVEAWGVGSVEERVPNLVRSMVRASHRLTGIVGDKKIGWSGFDSSCLCFGRLV